MSLINISYAGISINGPMTIRPHMETVNSPSGRTICKQVLTLVISGYIYHYQLQQKGITWQQAFTTLNSQGQVFNYTENGNNIITCQPVTNTSGYTNPVSQGVQYYDVEYGPFGKVEVIENNPASIQVVFTLTCTISPQNSINSLAIQSMAPDLNTGDQAIAANIKQIASNDPISGQLMDCVMDVVYVVDEEGYETRTISGELLLSGAAGQWIDVNGVSDSDSWRFAALNANRFLGFSILNPPPYYVRAQYNWKILPDRRTIRFVVVDRQVDWVPPYPCTSYDAVIELHDNANQQLGTIQQYVAVKFTLPPATAQVGGAPTGAVFATDPDSARTNAADTATGIMLQSMQNFVLNKNAQKLRVFISDMVFKKSSFERNTWMVAWGSVLARTALYDKNGWAELGLYATPINTSYSYLSPGPYGFDGLRGSAYSASQDQSLGLYMNRGNYDTSIPNNSQSIQPQAVTDNEGNSLHNEVAHVFYDSQVAYFPNGSSTAIGNQTFQGIPILIVSGYKCKIVNSALTNSSGSGNDTNYPRPVTPAAYFNIVNSFEGSTNPNALPAPTTTGSPSINTQGGAQPINAIVLGQEVVNHTPIPSKLNDTWFAVTEYSFVVAIDPATVKNLNVQGNTLTSILPGVFNTATLPNATQNATDNTAITTTSNAANPAAQISP